MRSRRKPALFTSTSRRPKASTAVATSCSAWAQSATSAPSATASPPMARMASTTSPAGPVDPPRPSISAPRSLTTTLAPWRANSRAWARPIPRPAPVTITTRPSQMPVRCRPSRRSWHADLTTRQERAIATVAAQPLTTDRIRAATPIPRDATAARRPPRSRRHRPRAGQPAVDGAAAGGGGGARRRSPTARAAHGQRQDRPRPRSPGGRPSGSTRFTSSRPTPPRASRCGSRPARCARGPRRRSGRPSPRPPAPNADHEGDDRHQRHARPATTSGSARPGQRTVRAPWPARWPPSCRNEARARMMPEHDQGQADDAPPAGDLEGRQQLGDHQAGGDQGQRGADPGQEGALVGVVQPGVDLVAVVSRRIVGASARPYGAASSPGPRRGPLIGPDSRARRGRLG